jgi:putative ABC transport system permease protein
VSVALRGVGNAFRNRTRTVAIVSILGLTIGLAFVMLTAQRSVSSKVATTLSSVGNTVTIGPPGFSAGGPLGKPLTTAEIAPIAHLHGVTGIDETLKGAATTIGTSHNPCPQGATCHVSGPGTGSGSAPSHHIKLGSTSLRSPMSLAARRAGLACEPKPCTPQVSGSQQIYFTGSTEPANPVDIGASTLRILSGHPISETSPADDAMISAPMARTNALKVGANFTAYGRTFTVAAIFATDNQAAANTVVTSLRGLQQAAGTPGRIFNATVTVDSLTDLAAVTSAIGQTLGPRASVVSNVANAEKAVDDLDGVTSIARYSLAGAVGAAAVILLLVMVLIVRERTREIGILKAIGASDARIMAQFITEAVTFTLLGWVVGILAGMLAASPITSALVSHSGVSRDTGSRGLFGAPNPFLAHLGSINTRVGSTVVLEGLGAALVVAVVASAASTWMIGRIRPAEVLRSD